MLTGGALAEGQSLTEEKKQSDAKIRLRLTQIIPVFKIDVPKHVPGPIRDLSFQEGIWVGELRTIRLGMRVTD